MASAPEIDRIFLRMPNKHYLLAQLEALGLDKSEPHLRADRRAGGNDRGDGRASVTSGREGRNTCDLEGHPRLRLVHCVLLRRRTRRVRGRRIGNAAYRQLRCRGCLPGARRWLSWRLIHPERRGWPTRRRRSDRCRCTRDIGGWLASRCPRQPAGCRRSQRVPSSKLGILAKYEGCCWDRRLVVQGSRQDAGGPSGCRLRGWATLAKYEGLLLGPAPRCPRQPAGCRWSQ